MNEATSQINLDVPQPQWLRSTFVAVASVSYFLGRVDGLGGTAGARAVWWITAAVWFLLFLWALMTPYLKLTAEFVLIAERPFWPKGGASLAAPFEIVEKQDVIELHHGWGSPDRILLDRVPPESRGQLLAGLRDLAVRASARERQHHETFVDTFGVDPVEVDPSSWIDDDEPA